MSAPTLPTPSASPSALLELSHCDRCGVQGQVAVVLPSGMDLVFCGHHARQYAETCPAVAMIEL